MCIVFRQRYFPSSQYGRQFNSEQMTREGVCHGIKELIKKKLKTFVPNVASRATMHSCFAHAHGLTHH